MTAPDLQTVMLIHGWVAVLLLAGSVGLPGLWVATRGEREITAGEYRGFSALLVFMAAAAWISVLAGTYWAYPRYRAVPPDGTPDLGEYPRLLLLASPGTAKLHAIGMEWKEHVAWLAPITLTAAAWLFVRYGRQPQVMRMFRTATVALAAVGLFSSLVAGAAGTLLHAFAPMPRPLVVEAQSQHD